MKLIGMMDSPYVRRVAVSLALYGVEFESLPLSVFSGFDEFSRINPVVKAPTVVLDNGTQLMDSTLILHYFETTNPAGRRLLPVHPEALARDLHLLGVILAACEKAVQHVYEHRLRPEEKQHQPWIARVTGQRCWPPVGSGTPGWQTAPPPRSRIRCWSPARWSGPLSS